MACLRDIARDLSIPCSGSGDELRQCIEGKLLVDRSTTDIVVTVKETPVVEQVLVLADPTGNFLETTPSYRSTELGENEVQLRELRDTLSTVQEELHVARQYEENLQLDVECARQHNRTLELQQIKLEEDMKESRTQLAKEKERSEHAWSSMYSRIVEHDAAMAVKDDEVAALNRQLEDLRATVSRRPTPMPRSRYNTGGSRRSSEQGVSPSCTPGSTLRRSRHDTIESTPLSDVESSEDWSREGIPSSAIENEARAIQSMMRRRGKAPPVDSFTGEDPEIRLEDWLPALQRASEWNGWSNADQLLQLAGHLRGRALQEWNLLEKSDKSSYNKAIDALRARLDPGSKALAAQDFRHSSQGKEESVADFVRRLEKLYQLAYGGDDLKAETKDALLYGQLYEGLRMDIMRGPAVSGSQGYKQLCVSAKGEEHSSRGNSMASRPFHHRMGISFLQMWKVGQSLATGTRAPLKLWTPGDATSVAGLGIWQKLVEFASPRAREVQAEQVQAALVRRPSRSDLHLLSKIPLDSSLRSQSSQYP